MDFPLYLGLSTWWATWCLLSINNFPSCLPPDSAQNLKNSQQNEKNSCIKNIPAIFSRQFSWLRDVRSKLRAERSSEERDTEERERGRESNIELESFHTSQVTVQNSFILKNQKKILFAKKNQQISSNITQNTATALTCKCDIPLATSANKEIALFGVMASFVSCMSECNEPPARNSVTMAKGLLGFVQQSKRATTFGCGRIFLKKKHNQWHYSKKRGEWKREWEWAGRDGREDWTDSLLVLFYFRREFCYLRFAF